MRPGDIVGRYGGDEFIMLVIGITILRAAQIAESLPGWDLPALLTHADQAMYEAQRAGGGSWRIYEDSEGATQAAISQAAAPARCLEAPGRPAPASSPLTAFLACRWEVDCSARLLNGSHVARVDLR